MEIKGLDYDGGISSFNGKEEDYFKVLRSYVTGTKTKLDLLETLDISNKDGLKNYEITVHGIKGTSKLICAQDTGEEALALEKAAAAGDIEYIKKHHPPFIQKARKLVIDLENAFKKIDSEKVKPKKDTPDKTLLAKLAQACDIYDMMEVDAAIKELDSYEYDSDNELIAWLKSNAEEMNYEAIAERIKRVNPHTF